MADEDDSEKTEDPTQKRLDDALERGDVAKSQEVNTWFIIAGATLALSSFSGSMVSMKVSLRDLLANSHAIRVDGTSLLGPVDRIAERMKQFAAAGVTTLSLAPYGDTHEETIAALRVAAEALAISGVAA